MQTIEQLLAEAPAFNGMSQEHLELIAGCAQNKTFEDGSYLINISFTSPDRDKAAVIANRIAELYVEDQLRTKQSATGKASVWLEQRLAELREEVRQSTVGQQLP